MNVFISCLFINQELQAMSKINPNVIFPFFMIISLENILYCNIAEYFTTSFVRNLSKPFALCLNAILIVLSTTYMTLIKSGSGCLNIEYL